MREKYQGELKELTSIFLEFSRISMEMLVQSVSSLKNQDEKLAQQVYENRKILQKFDYDIEDKSLRLIALYQPMAKDLRIIASILKMSTDLYRIGRYGKDIALVVIEEFTKKPHFKEIIHLPQMADIVKTMIMDSLDAFKTEDPSKIKDISDRDHMVDEMRYSIYRECITYMMENPSVISQAMNYTMIARYLERCGDHACNLASKIFYIITGERKEIK